MNPVGFLLIALLVAALGIVIAVGRHSKPARPESAMEEFRREMRALAPRDQPGGRSTPSTGVSQSRSGTGVQTDPAEDED
ncbi:MAG: hypothetical protein U5K29_13425 [Acidimicrobiales bacterium]|nr:hypothetical protein [Acidimicrobiales bacterium]